MKALLQRVRHARVEVEGRCVGEIEQGLLVFLGVEQGDNEAGLERLLERVLNYRVFADEAGRMNLSVRDIAGGVLLVSQFTLAADTRKGRRPGFSTAAEPAVAEALYQRGVAMLNAHHSPVATGEFGADMQISLLNDGPVTFLLEQ
ncbi:MAG: D-aminoacyl-tRNA deacylase [Spongiibacter sp.]|uniref:D-aminoacyl-tRNA deacylase n=1 Tax=Spongiibacter thalassae TaxID=2721624 RepID=A0ABX1GLK8_9GAMM|nr:D-aminoacyl-tRNA deacylase [Spongiibacter thalassae]NKI19227.1 D-tyrosyl-tRNA(Tyr) deacylase [Spongiibacter thalassae]